jgi:thymidine phosphorylase
VIASGQALARLEELIVAQGGDPRVAHDPDLLPKAPVTVEVRSPEAGLVVEVEPRAIGYAIIGLGGGRMTSADPVDPAVGVVIPVKPGQRVAPGQLLATVHARDEATGEVAAAAVRKAIRLGERASPMPLISHRITREGVVALTA